jgi:hypothetical protein
MDHSIQFLVKIQFLHLNYLVVEQLILNYHLLYKIKGSCHFSPIHGRLFSFFLTKSRYSHKLRNVEDFSISVDSNFILHGCSILKLLKSLIN